LLQNQTESPFILDATTLPEGLGAIVFDGNKIPSRQRRFWLIEQAGKIKFTLEKNDLKPDCRLTITGFEDWKIREEVKIKLAKLVLKLT